MNPPCASIDYENTQHGPLNKKSKIEETFDCATPHLLDTALTVVEESIQQKFSSSDNVSNHGNGDNPQIMDPEILLEEEQIAQCAVNIFSSHCGVCVSNLGKYRCSGCQIIYCSLKCFNEHKNRDNCKGTRNRTQFVSLSKFDDNQLVSDISLLNDMSRMKEAAKRKSRTGDEKNNVSKRLRILQRQCKQFEANLHFLPSGMSKHENNTSFYNHQRRIITWHATMVFGLLAHTNTTASSLDIGGLDDHIPINEAVPQLLNQYSTDDTKYPQLKSILDHYPADYSKWRFFLEQAMCPSNRKLFHPMNGTLTMRQTLVNLDVLEYPTIHVTTEEFEQEYEVFSAAKYSSISSAHLESIESIAAQVENVEESSEFEDSSISSEASNMIQQSNVEFTDTVPD